MNRAKARLRDRLLDRLWYQSHPMRWLFVPFAGVFQAITSARRLFLENCVQEKYPVPVIVVGNITVGGVGKTPLVIALAQAFKERGLRVGIVSRGYGASIRNFPHLLLPNDTAAEVGDEPLLIAQKTQCPVVIARRRGDAVRYLLEAMQSEIIISDDGLQHYRMGRAIEIAVIDASRGLGNGLLLPAGPLRETAKRLQQVDFIVSNGSDWPKGYRMELQARGCRQLLSGQEVSLSDLPRPVAAFAGIGNPKRFFSSLESLGLEFKPYTFSDHQAYLEEDVNFPEKTLLMTEKDAVKCQAFANSRMYVLPVEAKLDKQFWEALFAHEQLAGYRTNEAI